jgi:hypothetical protein
MDAGDEPPLLVWGGERSFGSGKEMLDPDGKGCYT